MPLSLKPLRCPHCNGAIGKAEMADKALRRQLLARAPIACPHCQGRSQLPTQAEKLISIGLLLAVIGAPLSLYWGSGTALTAGCFGLGLGLLLWGASRQQLMPSDTQQEANNEQE
ncbi:MAG: hypothetical protein OIF35_09300 [Cellvibrionaceae bacterium]|nr:hypothetical protein [Cellvibrionaceae bacterium]MCV6626260.1 hypothetical protein [Cellvibrionaceae bacterium]